MAPSLLLQNSVLPTEPDIAAYCREIVEKPDELKKMAEIRESRIAEVEALPDEHVDKFLRACVNALSEERRRGMSSKKKRVVLRHMLEAVREAEASVDNPFDGEDSEANWYRECIIAFKSSICIRELLFIHTESISLVSNHSMDRKPLLLHTLSDSRNSHRGYTIPFQTGTDYSLQPIWEANNERYIAQKGARLCCMPVFTM